MADITVTPASVLPSTNAGYGEGIAGATIIAGQSLYIDTADANKLKLADANAVAPANLLEGVSLHGASAGQPIKYQKSGLIEMGATLVKGTTYVLSATPGGIAPAADVVTGWTVNHVGVATSTTVMWIRIFNTAVTV